MKKMIVGITLLGLVGCSNYVYKDKSMVYNPTECKNCFEMNYCGSTKSDWKHIGTIKTDSDGKKTMYRADGSVMDTDFPY